MWGATNIDGMIIAITTFQSTHPVWGATSMHQKSNSVLSVFQSTHPVWGATERLLRGEPVVKISIHAPRVGCDVQDGQVLYAEVISIHAPRVGCDDLNFVKIDDDFKFQSTHPVWGATLFAKPSDGFSHISIHAPRVGCDRTREP